MKLSIQEESALSMCFKTAFLLTRNAPLAEAIVIEAIEHDDSDWISTDGLLRSAVAAANLPRFRTSHADDQGALLLPPELKRVLDLEDELRCSFVLRTLLGLSALECAGLLDLTPQRVNELAGRAASELTRTTDSAFQTEADGMELGTYHELTRKRLDFDS